jgi:hypothetical protein
MAAEMAPHDFVAQLLRQDAPFATSPRGGSRRRA